MFGSESEQEKFEASIGWTKADYRPSAIAIGTTTGLICVLFPFVLVFCLDLPVYRRHLMERFLPNLTGERKGRHRAAKEKRLEKKSRNIN